ncbi:hypothetical protein H311_02902 [Anncaliia algerae PRA109]|nr:hypothetical protein H311_02902 [Anncaliia algerae PRA109]
MNGANMHKLPKMVYVSIKLLPTNTILLIRLSEYMLKMHSLMIISLNIKLKSQKKSKNVGKTLYIFLMESRNMLLRKFWI